MIIKYNNFFTIKRKSQYNSFMILLSNYSKICCLSIPLFIANKYNYAHKITIYRNFANIKGKYYQNIYTKYRTIYASHMNYYYNVQEIMVDKEKYIDFYSCTMKTKFLMLKLYDSKI